MSTFKQWILENNDAAEKTFERWENFIHHVGEEELASCKVNDVVLMTTTGNGSTIHFIADCNDEVNDEPRKEGEQPDLSEKLTKRFMKHRIPLLSPIMAKVFHVNADPR